VRRRLAAVLTVLATTALAAGCASVPDSSSVDVLHRVTEGNGTPLPPGPGDNASPLDLVRGFINASASADNQHAAARRFLTPESQSWDDATSLTVIGDQLGPTSYVRPVSDTDHATLALHGVQLGTLAADGSFTPDETSADLNFELRKLNGQWRLVSPPAGTIVRQADFTANYRPLRVYFIDPQRHTPVVDRRYVSASPEPTLPSRVMDRLLSGPSSVLTGVAVSAIPPTARLRSNVALDEDSSVTVDLTELGDLNDSRRRLIAQQVVLSMAGVGVGKVTLLDDGAPLLPDHPVLTQDTLNALGPEDAAPADLPGLVVVNGRVHTMTTNDLGGVLPGPAGAGAYDLTSATISPDGGRIAGVERRSGRQLLTGPLGGPLAPTGVRAAWLSQPTWTAGSDGSSEVWTVRDRTTVARLVLDQSGHSRIAPVNATELSSRGPIDDLRVSKDGVRIAAIVGGQLVVGTIERPLNGPVAIGSVRALRPAELADLSSVAWQSGDRLAVAGRSISGIAVARVSVDGLDLLPLPPGNLTGPLTSVAAAPGRPLLVTDQKGLWSFGMDDVGSWRQISNGSATVAGYPD
jgi:hypothetical protein